MEELIEEFEVAGEGLVDLLEEWGQTELAEMVQKNIWSISRAIRNSQPTEGPSGEVA